MQSWRTWLAVFYDGCVFVLSVWIAFWLRFEGQLTEKEILLCARVTPVVLGIRFCVSILFGLYKGIFRYASLNDLLKILQATTVGSAVFAISIYFFFLNHGFPRSVFIIDWLLVVFLCGFGRFAYRLIKNRDHYRLIKRQNTEAKHTVLVVGAGDAGEMIVRDIQSRSSGQFRLVGFVDDSPARQGKEIHGIRVLGPLKEIPKLVEKYYVNQVLIAIPSLTGKQVQRIVHLVRETGANCLTLPSVEDIVDGTVRVDMIREVNINDLIRRDHRDVLTAETLSYIQGKRIMVTGAAGSIGSEIVRQLMDHKPASLILIDQGETPVFDLQNDLIRKNKNNLSLKFHVADIRDNDRMTWLFTTYEPQVVFHAAAYKHVPLMEEDAVEAFKTNCFGTRYLAHLSHRFHVESFVMLSTDKAADPANFMGASKRWAEKYIQAIGIASKTRFVSVRFGNVLGTKGSVVPFFQRLIRQGGPLPVTSEDIERYFMTVQEAAGLVLHSGGVGKSGQTMVLEMGVPLKIKDLAEELIQLSGLKPYEDIDIIYTGLRPGEKKTEILIGKNEKLIDSGYDFVQTLQGEIASHEEMERQFKELEKIISISDLEKLSEFLIQTMPEYLPDLNKIEDSYLLSN